MKRCFFELTATPDTSPRCRSAGSFRKLTSPSNGISGTGCCAQMAGGDKSRSNPTSQCFTSPPSRFLLNLRGERRKLQEARFLEAARDKIRSRPFPSAFTQKERAMRRLLPVLAVTIALAAPTAAQNASAGAASARTPNVEFDMMTWPEVKKAIQDG